MNLYSIEKLNGEEIFVVSNTMIEALQHMTTEVRHCELIASGIMTNCELKELIVTLPS